MRPKIGWTPLEGPRLGGEEREHRLEPRDVRRELARPRPRDLLIDLRPRADSRRPTQGTYSAIHLTTVRSRRPAAGLTAIAPMAMQKTSLRWHIIWGADMRPQRRGLSALTGPRGPGSPPVLRAGQRLHASQRSLTGRGAARRPPRGTRPGRGRARPRRGQQVLERGSPAQGVELRAPREGGRDEVPGGHRALEVGQPALVLAHVAEEPALLEDRFRVVHDLERAELVHVHDHVGRPLLEPRHAGSPSRSGRSGCAPRASARRGAGVPPRAARPARGR